MRQDRKEFLAILAYLYLRHGQLEKAGPLYAALSREYPHDPRFAAALGYLRLKAGRFDEALALAERARELAVADDMAQAARTLLAHALWGLGRAAEARRALGVHAS